MTARFTKERKIAVIVGATVMAIFLCLGVGMVLADDGDDGEGGIEGLGEVGEAEGVGRTVKLREGIDGELSVDFKGAGTVDDPYKVESAAHLDAVREIIKTEASAYFKQTGHIDLGLYIDEYYCGDTELGWLPIGPFSGTYDGDGYQVRNLKINRPGEENLGLFGKLGNQYSDKPLVKNIALVKANVQGGEGSKSKNKVGALVGYNYKGTIRNCSVDATSIVNGDCHHVGGLVGHNALRIENSYSRASVTGNNYGGGLVGVNYGSQSKIINSYAAGVVVATDVNKGGLLGGLSSGAKAADVTSSYYDRTVSGQSDENKGIRRTTAYMKMASTFEGWDFINIWDIDSDKNDGYPYLRVEVEFVREVEEEAGDSEPSDGGDEGGSDPGDGSGDGGDEGGSDPGDPPVSVDPPASSAFDDDYAYDYDDSDNELDVIPAVIDKADEAEDLPHAGSGLPDMGALLDGLQEDLRGWALVGLAMPEDVRLLDPEFQPSNYYRAVVSADQGEGGRLVNLPTIFVWDGRSWQGMSVLPKLDIKWKGVSLAANQVEMNPDEEVMSLAEGLLVEGSDIMVSPLYEYDFIDADLLTGALDFLAGRQIMRGYGSADSYLLNANGAASRAEFLAVLLRSLGLDLFLPGTSGFVGTSNSPEATWYEAYVDLAADLGLLEQLLSLGHEFSDLEDELISGAGHEYWGQSISLLEAEILIEQLESLALYQNYLLLRERLDEMGLVYQLGMKVLEPVGENDIVIGSAKDDKRVKNVSVHEDIVDGDAYLTRAEMAELIYQLVFE